MKKGPELASGMHEIWDARHIFEDFILQLVVEPTHLKNYVQVKWDHFPK